MTPLAPVDSAAPADAMIEISVFGPGYGECVVVHLGAGRWLIVDSCAVRKRATPAALDYLRGLGVDLSSQVDLIVATHWHDDHVRGLAEVVESCTAAEFWSSAALGNAEFMVGPDQAPSLPSKITSGVAEFVRLKRALSARTPLAGVRLAAAADLLVDREGPGIRQVWALSPSAADQVRGRESIERRTDEALKLGLRVSSLGPNDSSIVLQLIADEGSVLLGADLEVYADTGRGWLAVLADGSRPLVRSSVWKVAHHGSRTGYCARVWEEMLERDAVAVIAPWELAGRRLPEASDVDRVLSHTSRAYLTSTARGGHRRLPAATARSIVDFTVDFRPTPSMGHVQVRFDAGGIVIRGNAAAQSLAA